MNNATGRYTFPSVLQFAFVYQGVTFPCIHAVWSRWAPPLERSRMATMAFAGTYAGTIVAMPVSGILANKLGWESCFYVFGNEQWSQISNIDQ